MSVAGNDLFKSLQELTAVRVGAAVGVIAHHSLGVRIRSALYAA